MDITIRVHQKFSARVQRARLVRIARKTLRAEHAPAQTALTIYVTTDAEIRKLNRQFHATNTATDVLSFPSADLEGRLIKRRSLEQHLIKHPYLGDIVVSLDTAKCQARDAGWRIADEVDLLAVHGILHLLGYDDLTPRKRAKLWRRQTEILGKKIRTQGETF